MRIWGAAGAERWLSHPAGPDRALGGRDAASCCQMLLIVAVGCSSALLTCPQDGVLLGAVGAYDWNGAVLKDTKHGKVVPPKSSLEEEFPEELKNHAAYLGKGAPAGGLWL